MPTCCCRISTIFVERGRRGREQHADGDDAGRPGQRSDADRHAAAVHQNLPRFGRGVRDGQRRHGRLLVAGRLRRPGRHQGRQLQHHPLQLIRRLLLL